MSYNTYSVTSACAMCGNTTASSIYCPGGDQSGHVPGCDLTIGNHIHRQCARCSYKWIELPVTP